MYALEVSEDRSIECDAVPYDIPTDREPATVVVRIEDEQQMDSASVQMGALEQEFVRVLEMHYAEYRKKQRSWTHARLILAQGKMLGLLVAFELVATTTDAQIQASLWDDRLSPFRLI